MSFLPGIKVSYELPMALTTGISNSEGERTKLVQGTHRGDLVTSLGSHNTLHL